MVWCRCPKRVFVGHRVFRIAVPDAVICFNEGCSGRFKVIQQLTGRVGSLCRKGLKSIDSRRVSKAEKKLLAPDAKKRRRRQRVENTSENEGEEFYEAGMHWKWSWNALKHDFRSVWTVLEPQMSKYSLWVVGKLSKTLTAIFSHFVFSRTIYVLSQ